MTSSARAAPIAPWVSARAASADGGAAVAARRVARLDPLGVGVEPARHPSGGPAAGGQRQDGEQQRRQGQPDPGHGQPHPLRGQPQPGADPQHLRPGLTGARQTGSPGRPPQHHRHQQHPERQRRGLPGSDRTGRRRVRSGGRDDRASPRRSSRLVTRPWSRAWPTTPRPTRRARCSGLGHRLLFVEVRLHGVDLGRVVTESTRSGRRADRRTSSSPVPPTQRSVSIIAAASRAVAHPTTPEGGDRNAVERRATDRRVTDLREGFRPRTWQAATGGPSAQLVSVVLAAALAAGIATGLGAGLRGPTVEPLALAGSTALDPTATPGTQASAGPAPVAATGPASTPSTAAAAPPPAPTRRPSSPRPGRATTTSPSSRASGGAATRWSP